nr:MAG TPA: hypothetical protein [Crassvirales sp.]DAP79196.1 MAG TPA: hypothetical protein [Caudoviricetes sp.]
MFRSRLSSISFIFISCISKYRLSLSICYIIPSRSIKSCIASIRTDDICSIMLNKILCSSVINKLLSKSLF